MAYGQVELPKLGMSGGGQLQDAELVVQVLVAAPRSEDGQHLRAFAEESRDALRRKGHGEAMEEWNVPLPENPAVDPGDEGRHSYALGWGIVAVPCPVVELSADPSGGFTRVALPFLNMSGWAPSGAADPTCAVEAMLQAVAAVCEGLERQPQADPAQGGGRQEPRRRWGPLVQQVVPQRQGRKSWTQSSRGAT